MSERDIALSSKHAGERDKESTLSSSGSSDVESRKILTNLGASRVDDQSPALTMIAVLRKPRMCCLLVAIVLIMTALYYIYIKDNAEVDTLSSNRFAPVMHMERSVHNAATQQQNDEYLIDSAKTEEALQRVKEYCNNVDLLMAEGQEGKSPGGYTLESVHILIRHGDRSPIYRFPGQPPVQLDCRVNVSAPYGNVAVRDYVNTMRRVYKTQPVQSVARRFGLFPNSEHCVGAQLTGVGAVQHIRNGQFLYDKYIKNRQIIPDNYHKEDLMVFTTEYTRTFQSAIAFLYGFLPDFHYKRIRILTTSDIHFCTGELNIPCSCPSLGKLRGTVQREYSRRFKTYISGREYKREFSKVMNIPSGRLPWASAIMDYLSGFTCHGKPLPCSVQSKKKRSCVTWPLVGKVWKFLDQNGASQLQSFANKKLQHLQAHPFMLRVARQMLDRTTGKYKARITLFAAHDTTLIPVLSSIGIHSGHWPPYASRLVFELYSLPSGDKKEYFIRILFNGKSMTEVARFCHGKTIQGMCPLQLFLDFVFLDHMSKYSKDSYEKACRS